MKINTVALLSVLSAVATAPVFAADASTGFSGISTDAIVSQLGTVATMVGGVGMAALGVVMGIRAIGYIKSALGR